MDKKRCGWAEGGLYIEYHDTEWGVPVHDDVKLFEMLVLEGAQAGLSWITVLKKREGYRRAFRGFDLAAVAGFTDADIEKLLNDPGIIRNRLKITSAVENARAALRAAGEFGSFDEFIWSLAGGRPATNSFEELSEIPAQTDESVKMSRELKKRGFKFCGPTICYAFMQAVGMVNDHLTGCFRHAEISKAYGGGQK